jgi:hypothetical protein
MLGLEKIVAGAKLRGVAGQTAVEVVRVEWIGSDALNVVYRGNDGPAEVLLFRDAEPRLELVQATRAFSFDGDGETFRIASEAQRSAKLTLKDSILRDNAVSLGPGRSPPGLADAWLWARCRERAPDVAERCLVKLWPNGKTLSNTQIVSEIGRWIVHDCMENFVPNPTLSPDTILQAAGREPAEANTRAQPKHTAKCICRTCE